ncbi:TetR/AcrR family transcriptional regulator [Acrocarpospora sp. B8E8]|uniref:TetR/AcrR family transcriptional regulator n=1 Tax=Acrocarpospora sp. B8E8 TaxID=3153572 RepID=UPI00325C96DE
MDVPTPPWRTPRKIARQQLSQDLIVRTGLRILDEEGLEALSMRRVAQELGTGPASLYAHVANKEELLELIFDEVVGEIEVPVADPARWRDQLKELCWHMYRVLGSHADVGRLALASIPVGPNAARVSEAFLSIMLAGGLPPQVATWGLDRLYLYVTADAYESSLFLAKQRASGLALDSWADQFFGQVRTYLSQLPADRFPSLTGNVDAMMRGDGDERFEFGLEMLLRGLDSFRDY